MSPALLAGLVGLWRWDPGQGGEATYLRRQAIADGVHVVGGRRWVHEAV